MTAVLTRVGTRAASASATSLAAALPSTAEGTAGALFLAVVTSKNNAAHSCSTSGWTLIGQQNSGATFTASLWLASATAVAPTFTWADAASASAQVAFLTDPQGRLEATVAASTVATGSNSTHTSSAFTSNRYNALAVYVDVAAANTGLNTPTGWTEFADTGSGTDAGRTAWGSKELAGASVFSGAISVTGAAAPWVQWQVQIASADATDAQFSKAEVDAWMEPGSGAAASKVEVGAWFEVAEGRFSKIEVAAWLDGPPVPSGYFGIYHGAEKVTALYHGGVKIGRVYSGSSLVFRTS